jgi:import inner membrane translocase subunit TIM50
MLSRSILPLVRARPVPSAVRLSVSAAQHSRWYAKNNKPKVPYKLPGSSKSCKSEQSGSTSESSSSQNKPQQQQGYSPHEAEFAESTKDTPPQSDIGEAKSKQEYSPHQAEFDTAAPSQDGQQQPQRPLPDLTQGIPSTLAAELDAARSKKKAATPLNLTEDPSRDEDYEDAGAGGDGPKDGYVSSLDRRRARMANIMYALFLLGGVGGTAYLGRNWDTEEEARAHPEAPSGWGLGLFWNRMKARLDDLTSYYKDPAFEKLLPDEDPQMRQPYTLVLSLEDLLVHSEWTREHGWRVAKRPGVDYFLRYLNQYYELVLFTSVPSMMADQVLRKLDPYRIIRWPLFREATKYKDGEYVKVSGAQDFLLMDEF